MLGLLALAVATAGCGPSAASSPTPSATTSSSATAGDLTRPGAARTAVKALQRAAGSRKVIKVDITRTTATLSALDGQKVVAWQYQAGVVTPTESDIADIQQATFDPADYHFDALASIFAQAARISGSSSNQELQVVEYDHGRVLMTVTTTPESMPVFFRADGTPINRLAFPSAAAFTEAIKDTTSSSKRVLAMGWSADGGFWADTASSTAGVVDRTTRQAKVPSWTASRKADATGPTFLPGLVDPAVLSRLVQSLPTSQNSPGATVSFQIARIDQMALPLITWSVGNQTVITTLRGTVVTDVAGG